MLGNAFKRNLKHLRAFSNKYEYNYNNGSICSVEYNYEGEQTMKRDRVIFTDDERFEIVIMDIRGEPVNVIAGKLNCQVHAIYQARRSVWYRTIYRTLKRVQKDSELSEMNIPEMPVSEAAEAV